MFVPLKMRSESGQIVAGDATFFCSALRQVAQENVEELPTVK